MEKFASYLGTVAVFGLLGNLIGWWREWFWGFLGSLVLCFILFLILQKQGKIKTR